MLREARHDRSRRACPERSRRDPYQPAQRLAPQCVSIMVLQTAVNLGPLPNHATGIFPPFLTIPPPYEGVTPWRKLDAKSGSRKPGIRKPKSENWKPKVAPRPSRMQEYPQLAPPHIFLPPRATYSCGSGLMQQNSPVLTSKHKGGQLHTRLVPGGKLCQSATESSCSSLFPRLRF